MAAQVFGLVRDDGVIDLAQRTGAASLHQFLATGSLERARRYVEEGTDYALETVSFLPVMPDPRHIACVATNYARHIAEVTSIGKPRALPDWPPIFLRTIDSLVGHGQPLVRPRVSRSLDFEGELAIIIGKAGRYISPCEALAHVAGYTCFNDGSVRDFQLHTNSITPGKNFPATGGTGPWLVTADHVDPARLRIRTRLNGVVMQDGETSDMIFNVPAIISYVSSFIILSPGDIIATGTPDGIGFSRSPQVFMNDGDVCEVEIEGIGTLIKPIHGEEHLVAL